MSKRTESASVSLPVQEECGPHSAADMNVVCTRAPCRSHVLCPHDLPITAMSVASVATQECPPEWEKEPYFISANTDGSRRHETHTSIYRSTNIMTPVCSFFFLSKCFFYGLVSKQPVFFALRSHSSSAKTAYACSTDELLT